MDSKVHEILRERSFHKKITISQYTESLIKFYDQAQKQKPRLNPKNTSTN